jgi:large subunit ribosomal protein L24
MSRSIRKGDQVIVLSGNDKGKSGPVLSRREDRVIIEGVNMRKKHMRRTQETQGGRIVEMEMPVHVSKVVLCDKEQKPIFVRMKIEKGERSLVYRKGAKDVVYRSIKKPA